jgi:alcohol dehydrogenase
VVSRPRVTSRAFEAAVAAMTDVGGTDRHGRPPPPDARASISPLALVGGGRTVIGSYLGSAVPEPVTSRSSRRCGVRVGCPVERLVSATVSLDEINEAMDALAGGQVLRQLIDLR